jgi:fibronectin-binding autotransporter adhesin
LNLGQTDINLRGTLGWRHAFGDVDPDSTHAFYGGKAFTVAGTPLAQNAAIVEVGADVAVSRNLSMGLSYEGQYGSGNRDHNSNISMR